MPSTYSPLKIELPATGEQSGTWGNTTNTNLGTALEEAIVGSANVTFASANVTLTLTDTNASQAARNLRLNLTGVTGGSTRTLTVPAIEKIYLVSNNCADSVTVGNATGATVTVPAGTNMFVYNDGTDILNAITYFTSVSAATVNATTVDTTNLEVTNLKAKDGTSAGSIADATGIVTLASSVLTTTDINGGTVDNTAIGATTASTGKFSTLTNAALTSGRVTYAGTAGLLQDSANLTFNGTTLAAAGFSGPLTGAVTGNASTATALQTARTIFGQSFNGTANVTGSVTSSALTSGRVTYAGTGGLLQDDADLTFDGSTLTTLNSAYTGTLTGGTGVVNLGSGQFYKDASGNVGVGTSSPTRALTVYTTAATDNNLLLRSGASNAYLCFADLGTTDQTGLSVRIGSSGNNLVFNTGGTTERMRIDSSGNVGIGTSSPKAPLSFSNSASSAASINKISLYDDATNPIYGFGISANQLDYVSAASHVWYSGASERMRIASNGIITMSAYGAGAATFSAAGVISSVSDETWKTKDGVPTNPDAMLQKLEAGYWFYNEEKAPIFGKERQLGFYAQNVHEAIGEEAAPTPEEGKPWGYYDRSVLAVTVMSLKNALSTIEELKERIATLENK
jgi:hypothetical protein